MIKKYMEENGVSVSEVTKTSHDQSKFSSFKVSISKLDLDKVFDDLFWPSGVHCKMWWNREKMSMDMNDDSRDNKIVQNEET